MTNNNEWRVFEVTKFKFMYNETRVFDLWTFVFSALTFFSLCTSKLTERFRFCALQMHNFKGKLESTDQNFHIYSDDILCWGDILWWEDEETDQNRYLLILRESLNSHQWMCSKIVKRTYPGSDPATPLYKLKALKLMEDINSFCFTW